MFCTRLAENTRCKTSPSVHYCTTLLAYIFTTKACIDNRKNLLNSSISSTCPQQILTGFTSWLRYCTDVAQQRSTKLCTIFGCLLGWQTIKNYIHFGGSCPLMEFCHMHNLLCVLYWQHYCMALEQWATAKLCGMVQGKLLRTAHRFFHIYIWWGGHHVVCPCNIF